jgi:aminopeptidase N
MLAASGGSLPSNWAAWYDQPGTPWVSVDDSYDAASKTLMLEVKQGNAVAQAIAGSTYRPLPIPIQVCGARALQAEALPKARNRLPCMACSVASVC